jgi:hypothetical protein
MGASAFVAETRSVGDAEVLLGATRLSEPPPSSTARLEFTVSASTHPCIGDHVIRGTPVVPLMLVVEWFTRAAALLAPDLADGVLHDVEVLRAVRLEDFHGRGRVLQIRCEAPPDAPESRALELTGIDGVRYYRARLRHSAGPRPVGGRPPLEAWNGRKLYGDVLFHGPLFQVIDNVEGVSDAGIAGSLKGVRLAGWEGSWRTDAAAMDGGLQLALLWGREALGGATLPMRIGEVHVAGPVDGLLRCVLQGTRQDSTRTTSDLSFYDQEGDIVASLLRVETVLVPPAKA